MSSIRVLGKGFETEILILCTVWYIAMIQNLCTGLFGRLYGTW